MNYRRGFASDNNSGAHPRIIEAMQKINIGHTIGYGDDQYTKQAKELIKMYFGEKAESFFVYNGTAANVLSLKAMTNSFNSVICAETAHINVDECGAPEKFTGCKLLSVETEDGKLTPEIIKKHLHGFSFEHHSQPKVVSITQSTELGTVYTAEEIKKMADFLHKKNMLLHIDGARLSNAAAYLGKNFTEITADVGADAVSFGCTKNGGIFGEVIIFFRKELAENFKYYRKQGMQLASKMRFIAVQYIELLKDGLWKDLAEHSNKMAQNLAERVEQIPEIQITQKVQSNGVFAIIPPEIIPKLQKEYFFYMWDETQNEVRWMTSFDTKIQDIEKFVNKIKELL
ncbi:MAG: low specificity L-threonine aldolase [Candidatus Cloacimonadota bacterium]|nr:low specificity L-threonine aldolase [Candidatus Cloacimonadota bacterium]